MAEGATNLGVIIVDSIRSILSQMIKLFVLTGIMIYLVRINSTLKFSNASSNVA